MLGGVDGYVIGDRVFNANFANHVQYFTASGSRGANDLTIGLPRCGICRVEKRVRGSAVGAVARHQRFPIAVHVPATDDGNRPVDVVPAFFHDFVDGRPIYYIPSGDGEYWIRTSPQAHNAHLRTADERSGGKLKYTSQVFKWWREGSRILCLR